MPAFNARKLSARHQLAPFSYAKCQHSALLKIKCLSTACAIFLRKVPALNACKLSAHQWLAQAFDANDSCVGIGGDTAAVD